MNPDVLVIGGGSAGVAAAIAAARRGADTLLVERHAFFGGAGTASLVHSFCGLYDLPQTPEAAPQVANPGLPAELERELRAQGIAHGPLRMGKVDLTGDSPECPFDATDARSLTWIEMQGREVTFAIVEHLRTALEGFSKARITTLPLRAGIRESRRWIGETVLTEEDLLESRDSDDSVAYATWPMELRETARGPRLLYPREPKACGIPLGCLRARDLGNVFVAGRCLSATHRAQASIRVMGTAVATGQAAGIAAANEEQNTAALAQHVRAALSDLKA